MEYQTFVVLSSSVVGIAVIVGVIMYILRKLNVFPPDVPIWQNLSVVVLSIAVAVLGYWLRTLPLDVPGLVEAVWLGAFSAAVESLGYEVQKSIRKSI